MSKPKGRADGEGSFYPYRNGWAAYVWVTTPTGEEAEKYIYGQDKEKLYAEWIELKARAAKVPVPVTTPTVADYHRYWLKDVIKPNREAGTYSHYELMGRLHIIPALGKKKIDPKKLTVRVVQSWLNKLAETCQCCAQGKDAKRDDPKCCAAGKCCEAYPSKRVIESARGTLRAMLNHAKAEELVERNVAELVKLPRTRTKSKRRNSWTVDEARRFLESSRNDNDPYYPLWVLILVLGLRKGEALGLIDESIYADSGEIDLGWQLQRVGGHPLTHKEKLKTDGSADTLPLPGICVTALKIAQAHREHGRTEEWPGVCICGETHQLVFVTRNGRPIEPRNINRAFDIRCTRAGVRRITIHDTRRTCGSLLAALDVHPRVAMAILRHSRIALTMEIYTQVPDKSTRDALQRLGDWLDGPANGDGQGDGQAS